MRAGRGGDSRVKCIYKMRSSECGGGGKRVLDEARGMRVGLGDSVDARCFKSA